MSEVAPESSTASLSSRSSSNTSTVPEKVVIWFRPTGSAPILKQSKFKIASTSRFQAIGEFLRRQLHIEKSTDPLFLYINSSFSPTPEEPLANLYRCFSVDNILIVNYSITAAWG